MQWQLGCGLSEQAHWQEALAPLRQSLLLMESLEHCDTLDVACVCNGAPSVADLCSISISNICDHDLRQSLLLMKFPIHSDTLLLCPCGDQHFWMRSLRPHVGSA